MKDNISLIDYTNHRNLIAYKKADIIYELTVDFCKRFINSKDRTYDQMVQAARSGKQNIVEGNAASATSKATELHLINVAKASLKELMEDYLDYLHTNQKEIWPVNSEQVKKMRELGIQHDDAQFFLNITATRKPEIIANMLIVLLYQEDCLLMRLLKKLEEEFKEKGGFRENLYKYRKNNR